MRSARQLRSHLAARHADPADRRRHVIHLTIQGKSLAERSYAGIDDQPLPMLAPLTSAERAQLHELLAQILTPSPSEPSEA